MLDLGCQSSSASETLRKPHRSWVFLALIFKIPVGLLVKWVDVVTTWERVVVETVYEDHR